MATRTAVGRLLLAASVLLLALQCLWVFARLGPPPNVGFPGSLLTLAPYGLLMTSLYLLFSKKEILHGRGKAARFVIVLLVSWAAVGGAFLFLLLLSLYSFGPRAGDALFSYILWLLPLGMAAAFPFVARYLR